MRINLCVQSLLSEEFKARFCYMYRREKGADRHCLCQSLTSKDLRLNFLCFSHILLTNNGISVISDFHCEIDENCALLRYHSACSVKNWLTVGFMLCIPCRITPYHIDCKSKTSNSHRLKNTTALSL